MTHPAHPTRQAPGIMHRRVGDMIVTALNDGHLDVPLDILTNLDAGEAASLQRAHFRRDPPFLTLNSFVIWSDDGPVLVDTGAASTMGPTVGRLPENLAALGVAPGDVKSILLTHLHRDHAAGLVDADGRAAFPNATIFLHRKEAGFWLDPALTAAASEDARPSFVAAQGWTAPYRDRMKLVDDGETVPGAVAVPLPGHTPGHTGWLTGQGGLLIWGDIVHMPGVQFARPEVGVGFDVDGAMAAATRARVLDMAVTERLLVAGMHLDFPAFGNVARDGSGYRFVPATWDQML